MVASRLTATLLTALMLSLSFSHIHAHPSETRSTISSSIQSVHQREEENCVTGQIRGALICEKTPKSRGDPDTVCGYYEDKDSMSNYKCNRITAESQWPHRENITTSYKDGNGMFFGPDPNQRCILFQNESCDHRDGKTSQTCEVHCPGRFFELDKSLNPDGKFSFMCFADADNQKEAYGEWKEEFGCAA